ncbi:MAG: ABC transporter ATP-binding protein [Brevinematales bacterium]|nr:ABC transporter ATP-binding protein [Brevinematales bacterium]
MVAVKLENVEKYFGEFKALDGVSFEINEGEIVGFLGPNGAGKTTTMRIITGFMEQTSGKVNVYGFDNLTQADEIKQIIGYLPEHPPLYPELSVEEYLYFVGEIKDVPQKEMKRRVEEVIELVGLQEKRRFLISHLSKGYKQRVGIAQAIIHSPKLLILDEPTIGLDPIQIIEVRELIKKLSVAEKRTIILSTHILQEVNYVCQRAIIINKGKIVNDVPITSAGKRQFIVRVNKPIEDLKIDSNIEYSRHGVNNIRVAVSRDEELEGFIRMLISQDFVPLEITPVSTEIEKIFVDSVYS